LVRANGARPPNDQGKLDVGWWSGPCRSAGSTRRRVPLPENDIRHRYPLERRPSWERNTCLAAACAPAGRNLSRPEFDGSPLEYSVPRARMSTALFYVLIPAFGLDPEHHDEPTLSPTGIKTRDPCDSRSITTSRNPRPIRPAELARRGADHFRVSTLRSVRGDAIWSRTANRQRRGPARFVFFQSRSTRFSAPTPRPDTSCTTSNERGLPYVPSRPAGDLTSRGPGAAGPTLFETPSSAATGQWCRRSAPGFKNSVAPTHFDFFVAIFLSENSTPIARPPSQKKSGARTFGSGPSFH